MAAAEQRKLDFAEREVVLRANLEEADADRCVWASMRFLQHGPRHPRVGESVFLMDRQGGGSLGHVVELNGWLARVRLLPERLEV
jgi:kynureninase